MHILFSLLFFLWLVVPLNAGNADRFTIPKEAPICGLVASPQGVQNFFRKCRSVIIGGSVDATAHYSPTEIVTRDLLLVIWSHGWKRLFESVTFPEFPKCAPEPHPPRFFDVRPCTWEQMVQTMKKYEARPDVIKSRKIDRLLQETDLSIASNMDKFRRARVLLEANPDFSLDDILSLLE